MPHSNSWKLVASFLVGIQLTACQQKPDVPANLDFNRVEYTGPAVYRVRLTAKRSAELGIKTDSVREKELSGKLRKVIPVAAVIHDRQGNTWTFKSPDSLIFVRERISVDSLAGDLAILSDGPPVGALIVTTGAADLFNDEFSRVSEGIGESKTSEGAAGNGSSGTATMLENGNLKVVHRAAGASGLTASVVIEYKPQDEEYQQIIAQVGGLKAGETKRLPPLPDQ